MNLTSMSLDRFKGVTDSMRVSALNWIRGANGSGKSTRGQALRFALCGRLDPVFGQSGKTNDALSALMQGDECGVELQFADGWSVRRTLERRGQSISQKLTLPRSNGDGLGASTDALISRVGDQSIALILSDFLSGTAEDRRKRVLQLCGTGGGDSAADTLEMMAIYGLSRLLGGPVVEAVSVTLFGESDARKLTPKQQTQLTGSLWKRVAIERARERWQFVANEIAHDLECEDVSEGISSATSTVKIMAGDANRMAAHNRDAVQAMQQQRNALKVPTEAVATLKGERKTVQENIDALKARIAEQHGLAEARRLLAERLTKIAFNRNTAVRLRDDYDARAKELAAEAQRVIDLRAEADRLEQSAIQPQQSEEAANLQTLAREKRNEREELAEELATNDREHKSKSETLLDRIAKRERYASDFSMELKRLLAALWPHVSAEGEELFTSIMSIVAEAGKDTVAQIEFLDFEIPTLQNEVARLHEWCEEARARLAVLDRELRELRAKREASDKAAESAQRNWQQTRDRVKQLRDEANRIEDGITKATKGRDDAIDAIHRHDEERLAVENEERAFIEKHGAPLDVEDLGKQQAAAEAKLAEIDAKIEAKQSADALDQQIQAASTAAVEAEADHAIYAAALVAVKEAREAVLVRYVEPLIGRMDEFLSETAPEFKAFLRLANDRGTKATFDFGLRSQRGDVSYTTISGWESAAFTGALVYALIQMRQLPLRIIALEADGISPPNRERLAMGLQRIVERGDLDHVFIFGEDTRYLPGPPWNIVVCDDYWGQIAELQAVGAEA